jgi:macrolide-specific efflux system membrane fusion protein
MKKRLAWIIGGIAVIALALYFFLPKSNGLQDLAKQYDFHTVKRMDLSERIDATGKVLALEKKDLYADYDGAVEKVHVKAGDMVKQGDIIVTIDSATLKSQWLDAKSTLNQAKVNLTQTAGQAATELYLNQLSEKNALQLENYYQQAAIYREQVKQAQERLDALNARNDGYYMADNERLFIRAPFSGKVAWIQAQKGDKIDPQTLLATVMKPEGLIVEAQVDQNDISAVQTGQNALVTGKDDGQSQNPGVVTEISTQGREAGNVAGGQAASDIIDFPVRIRLNGATRGLMPGMMADVTVLAHELPDALAVPAAGVTRQNGRDLVKVRRQGQVVQVAVELGLKSGKYWEVKSGLKAGDVVAVPKPTVLAASPASGAGKRGMGPFGGR